METNLPDAAAIDWNGIALWAGGIVTVITSMVLAAWAAIRKAVAVAQTQPLPTTIKTESKIITTDSLAMEMLAKTLEASNVILTENNLLRREEHADRERNRETVEANTEINKRLLGAIEEARREIRELTHEIIKANTKFG